MDNSPCDHIQHHGLDECPGLTQAEIEFGEKVKTVGLQFTYGRDQFHGPTIREQTSEMFEHAENLGHKPPEYAGRATLV